MTIGEAIKKYRNDNKMSQREFAKKCGLSNGSISLLEKGVNPKTNEEITPSLPSLNSIAKGMGISLDNLLNIIDDSAISLPKKPKSEKLSKTQEFISLFEKLSPDQQTLIIKQIQGILSE